MLALLMWLLTAAAQAPQTPAYREHVEVARVLVDARVVDGRWRPIPELGPSDFVVRIDGRPARVESALWVAGVAHDREDVSDPDEGRPHLGLPAEAGSHKSRDPVLPAEAGSHGSHEAGNHGRPAHAAVTRPSPDGRLIVFVFQKDLESSRIVGLMRMLKETRSFVEAFTPRDRVAVLSFDSRLRVWLDFTADLSRVDHVLAHDVLFGGSRPVQSGDPTLLDAIPVEAARRTYSIEEALVRLGEALQPLPGSKVVVLVGHGFGRLGLGGVSLEPRYDDARRALQAARAAVFCLDVTQADYHSLEVGLQAVAEDTGGTYERTHIFSRAALDRLASMLGGHYVLFVEKPALGRGEHRIDVRLNARPGTVFARTAFVD